MTAANKRVPGGDQLQVGDSVELDVQRVAGDGQCVARVDGRVVFLRGALPGERVRASVTSMGRKGSFLRATVEEVLVASPDRVSPPCPLASECGGCDWQHASLSGQRDLKRDALIEALERFAKIDSIGGTELATAVTVTGIANDDGLGWRTRMRFAIDEQGQVGLRAARSHDVIPASDCLLPVSVIRDATPDQVRNFGKERALVAASTGDGSAEFGSSTTHRSLTELVHDRTFQVDLNGFWQVHVGAPELLVDKVLEFAKPEPGECALDLYSGVGLFSAFLAQAVTDRGQVTAVEGDRRATELSTLNTADLPQVRHQCGDVSEVLSRLEGTIDFVVLDPPRAGVGADVVDQLARLDPTRIVYVSCDMATFARDVRLLADVGFGLSRLEGIDLFPMTKHLETVALFER